MPSRADLVVLVNGTAVPGDVVVADVTIRSGRTRADDGLEPASSTIELLTATPGGAPVGIADDVQVTVNGSPRFTGRVAELGVSILDDGQTAYTLVAIGAIARLARITIPLPMAAGTAAARAAALFTAAGLPYRIQGGSTMQLAAYGQAGDPPTTADQVAGGMMVDTGCVIADQGDGAILVQFLDSRLGGSVYTPDPAETHVDLAWEQTDDLVNDATVSWSGGSQHSSDATSIGKYDKHSVQLSSGLGDASSATRRVQSIVARLAYPAWNLGDVTTWDDAVLGVEIGAIVEVDNLPSSSPVGSSWQGVLEGSVDSYAPNIEGVIIGTYDLALGDLKHSSEVLTWIGIDPQTLQWQQVNPGTSWSEAITNEDLQ
jgi:hypothetical protein